MNYGEAFQLNGVPDMEHGSILWCGKRQDGVVVVLAHQEFFNYVNGTLQYEDDWSHNARSRDAIADYEGEVILLVYINTWGCGNQKFVYATRVGYRGRMVPGSAIRVTDLVRFMY
jgi:hypothetical protein